MKYRILEEKEYNKVGDVIINRFYPQRRWFGFWWRKIYIGVERPELVWENTYANAEAWIEEQIRYTLKKVSTKTEKRIHNYEVPNDLEK
jgi:hypothetical protein